MWEKWQERVIRSSISREFLETYPGSEISLVHRENFEEFIVS